MLTICSATVIRTHAAATTNSTFPTFPTGDELSAATPTTPVRGVGELSGGAGTYRGRHIATRQLGHHRWRSGPPSPTKITTAHVGQSSFGMVTPA